MITLCICGTWNNVARRQCRSCFKRLEGVKGPERRLVGESRSDEPQVGAEERKERSDCSEEGRRVEEIAYATELRRHIERTRDEARELVVAAQERFDLENMFFHRAYAIALTDLLKHIDRMAEKRSDLLNAKVWDGDAQTGTREKTSSPFPAPSCSHSSEL